MAACAWGHPNAPRRLADPLGPQPGVGAQAAQILARVELASACSSWMGVRKLFPPGEEERARGGRWVRVSALWEAVWAGATLGTYWGAAARLCGAGAGPARPPRGQAGPGPGPRQQPAGGLWGGRVRWGGGSTRGRTPPLEDLNEGRGHHHPIPLSPPPFSFGLGEGPAGVRPGPPYPWGAP